MKPCLIAVDLDGTMLSSDGLLSQQNRVAIHRATALGIPVIPVTGRSCCLVPVELLRLVSFVITSNGAAITRVSDEKRLYTQLLPTEQALQALALLQNHNLFTEIFYANRMIVEQKNAQKLSDFKIPDFHRRYITNGNAITVDSFGNYLAALDEGIEKLNIPFCDNPLRSTLWKQLTALETLTLTSSLKGNIEITSNTCSKGRALIWLCNHLDISVKDVVAFGDEDNDVDMLMCAGFGVAMGNAAPTVYSAARYHTLSNNEHGVAVFLEREFQI